MINLKKAIIMMVAMAAIMTMGVVHAIQISFTINEGPDAFNSVNHIHNVSVNFSFDPTYGTGGVDANGYSLIDWTTVTGTITVPASGVFATPNSVLSIKGLAVNTFVGRLNDNLFNVAGNFFTQFGFAFQSTDLTHSYDAFIPSVPPIGIALGAPVGCAGGCNPNLILPVTNFTVPEPGSAALVAVGLIALFVRRRKQDISLQVS